MSCDVVVLGGGPAGLATGVALARLGRSVTVMERTRYERPRPGETFGGDLGPLLQRLGAWDDFGQLVGAVPFRGVRSAWGGSSLVDRASIFHPFGEGWHVDRARFDRALARAAERAGVVVRQGTGACAPAWHDGEWRVSTAAGETFTARFLVDASGRGAPATAVHVPGRRWLRADRLVALLGRLTAPARPIEPLLVLEAAEEGWWYSVPQPDGALLAVLITDADLLPARGRADLGRHFLAGLGRAPHTAERAAGASLASPPWIARAESGMLLPDRGRAWRAVGDAAMACDPLAGDGVTRALAAAFEAAPEIDRQLAGEEVAGQGGEALGARFGEYLDVRAMYYEREPRWRDAPFWARRRSIDWRSAPLLLDPRHVLRWDGTAPARDALAPVESVVPYGALRALFDQRAPAPAHEALALLRAAAPIGDRRLLVGLQLAAALGCVAVDG